MLRFRLCWQRNRLSQVLGVAIFLAVTTLHSILPSPLHPVHHFTFPKALAPLSNTFIHTTKHLDPASSLATTSTRSEFCWRRVRSQKVTLAVSTMPSELLTVVSRGVPSGRPGKHCASTKSQTCQENHRFQISTKFDNTCLATSVPSSALPLE